MSGIPFNEDAISVVIKTLQARMRGDYGHYLPASTFRDEVELCFEDLRAAGFEVGRPISKGVGPVYGQHTDLDAYAQKLAVEREREACAALIDARCVEVLAKQSGDQYPNIGFEVDGQLRMMTVLLPDLSLAIRARGGRRAAAAGIAQYVEAEATGHKVMSDFADVQAEFTDRRQRLRAAAQGPKAKFSLNGDNPKDKASKPGADIPLTKYDAIGKMTAMASGGNYVMARRPGCAPHVFTTKEWRLLSDTPVACAGEGAA